MDALRRALLILTAALLFTLLGACASELKTPPPQLPLTFRTVTPLPEPTVHFTASTPVPAPTQSPAPSPTSLLPTLSYMRGWMVSDQISGEPLEEVLPFWAYLPPGYGQNPDQRYPTLYLLHGLNFDENQWKELGLAGTMDTLIAAEKIPPFIVILPRIPNISTYPSSYNARIFANILVPYVDSRYQTLPERSYRAIGGLSRGAAWALRIGLQDGELFSRIGLHSLSMSGEEINTWVSEINALDPRERPALYLDAGSGDEDQDSAMFLSYQLNRESIPHLFILVEGEHSADYWAQHLPDYLSWYSSEW
ncbi:MAG: alpha/beta hydrolase-fold protein [Anaerolineaceae bacterium]